MIYLGIDGGGSKTAFLLMDDDREIGAIQSGPSNWLSVGRDVAANSIRDGISRLNCPEIHSVCGGFAGAGRAEGRAFYSEVLSALLPKSRIRIESDAFIAYVGAIGFEPGVLLIAGTGSIAIARGPDGRMLRFGGWGPHFGDEGGGFWIGREAIRRALHLLDADVDNAFARRIANRLGIGSVRDVPAKWSDGSLGVPDVAALFPEVVDVFPNEPATTILQKAAAELRGLVEAAGMSSHPTCASGSVATHPLMKQLIGIPFAEPKASPAQGAVRLARE